MPWAESDCRGWWRRPCDAHFHAANVSTFAYCFLTIAAANLLEAFGSAEQKARYMLPMLTGQLLRHDVFLGAAGRILARGYPHPRLAGWRWPFRITGNKMSNSGGEHRAVG